MLNKNAKYNFDAHLISASYNKELTHSKKEWVFIYEEKKRQTRWTMYLSKKG